jgi:hypothetical protein
LKLFLIHISGTHTNCSWLLLIGLNPEQNDIDEPV